MLKSWILPICASVTVMFLLGCWHTRYVFVSAHAAGAVVAVDRWSGCATWMRPQGQFLRRCAGDDEIPEHDPVVQ